MSNAILRFYTKVDSTRRAVTNAEYLKKLLTWFERGHNVRFLDIGCYDGSKTVVIASYINAKEIHGIDILPERLEQAHVRGVEVKVVDLNDERPLPYPDGYFDCIFCGDIIEPTFRTLASEK